MLGVTGIAPRAALVAALALGLGACGQRGRDANDPDEPYEVLARDYYFCNSIEVDADAVYLSYYEHFGVFPIERISLSDGSGSHLTRALMDRRTELASDEEYIYWSTGMNGAADNAVGRVRKDGSEVEVLVEDEGCYGVALLDDGLYYTYGVDVGDAGLNRRVERYDLITNATTEVYLAPTPGISLFHLQASGKSVFAVNAASDCLLEFDSDGGDAREITCAADWQSEWRQVIRGFAIDDGYAYLGILDQGVFTGGVARVPLSGGEPELVGVSTTEYPTVVGTHDGYVYWFEGWGASSDHDGRAVLARAPLEGGETEVLFDNLNVPRDLTFYDDWMYWCDYGNGDVVRAKVPEGMQ